LVLATIVSACTQQRHVKCAIVAELAVPEHHACAFDVRLVTLRQAFAANEQRTSSVSQSSMPNVKASADARLLDVLPCIGRTLGLQGLACLAASNQQFKHACLELLEQDSHHLLLDVLPPLSPECGLAQPAAIVQLPPQAAAAPAAAAATDQRLQPMLWLSRVVPGMATSVLSAVDVLQRLVHLPHVPLQHAKQLVADGVRIPYAQLLAAANSMVPG
jgi:hypothetical protein